MTSSTILSWLLILSPLVLIAIHFILKRKGNSSLGKRIDPLKAYIIVAIGFVIPLIVAYVDGLFCVNNGGGGVCAGSGIIFALYITFIGPIFLSYSIIFLVRFLKRRKGLSTSTIV